MGGAFGGAMALEFGSWAPVCGGWLRTRDAERAPSPSHLVRLARQAERSGYDFYYVPEHFSNAIHGPRAGLLDAWVVAAACVAATERIRVITAVQPGFKAPGVVAKMGATLSQFRPGAFGLSLLAGWWRLEVESYGDVWLPHAERYERAAEFLDVIQRMWREPTLDFQGKYFNTRGAVLEPKPEQEPPVFVAGESERAIEVAARAGHYLFINGGEPEHVARLVARAKARARDGHGRSLKVALSAFGIVRASDREACAVRDSFHERADSASIAYFQSHMDRAVIAHNRTSSVGNLEANLGLDSGLVGAPSTIMARLEALEQAGVDAVMVKAEPALEESERFARDVIHPYRSRAVPTRGAAAV